jgi:hypothetical protein
MKMNKKLLALAGLLVFCVIVAGVFMPGRNAKDDNIPQATDSVMKDVMPNSIDAPDDTNVLNIMPIEVVDEPVIIDVTPIEIVGEHDEADVQNADEIVLTIIDEKPEAPELPETAFVFEQDEDATPEDVEAYEALDPALKNPDVMPNITPAPVTPNNPIQNSPRSGDINDKGEMFIPGFGWIIYEGGGSEGRTSSSDGDWNKIIGY